MSHKHLPEMAKYTGLKLQPIFQPAVATFPQGMVVSVPLHYSLLNKGTTGKKVHDALTKHYEGSTFVKVMPLGESGVKEAGLLERGASCVLIPWPIRTISNYLYSIMMTKREWYYVLDLTISERVHPVLQYKI